MRVQEALGRAILIENPALYMPLDAHELTETEFLDELVRQSGCGLLIDVNNVYVSANNLGFSAQAYLEDFRRRHRRNSSGGLRGGQCVTAKAS